MSWCNAFTIAIIEKNPKKMGKLIKEIPTITDVNEAKQAQALIQEALKIIKEEQAKTRDSMEKNKKTRAFLMSANLGSSPKREYRG
ncbi:hypothetical protein [Sulfurospirillum halorespirans]|uniref:Uncharacterized protein n=1 Tax=Sulfurospirillum halorespirans DSM 13726 TaxID=1193502 RepID=A0A1D7TJE0_9BACT|nr:hypothetical protein [Sulfurospirillum halorespirans]AOO65135.1 hypothetical protein SHALO_1359 [Sulfurospirillum halorespirans DSM 13726]